jgi:SNF2 family DNA or RNA helicase
LISQLSILNRLSTRTDDLACDLDIAEDLEDFENSHDYVTVEDLHNTQPDGTARQPTRDGILGVGHFAQLPEHAIYKYLGWNHLPGLAEVDLQALGGLEFEEVDYEEMDNSIKDYDSDEDTTSDRSRQATPTYNETRESEIGSEREGKKKKKKKKAKTDKEFELKLRHSQLVGIAAMISHCWADETPFEESSQESNSADDATKWRDMPVTASHKEVIINCDDVGLGKTAEALAVIAAIAAVAKEGEEAPRHGFMIAERTSEF